jgi:nitroimidazol reductase NimA-like FMN-containing flavoprotein (pyridoxamine 5'-phosphate oxidase superfamily)
LSHPVWVEKFLRDRRVAVLAIPRPNRSPLTTPVWYDYDAKTFVVQVDAKSAKARALAGGEVPVSLTIQSEVPPYRYVVVHGRASLRKNDRPGLRRELARRYFGRVAGDMYVAQEEKKGVREEDLSLVEISADRFLSHDFSPEAGMSGRLFFSLYRWLKPVPA